VSADARLVLGTGFCGGYTTFSTASVETVRLAQQRRFIPALLYAVATAGLSLAAAAVGIVIAR
jgi:CrcB protein